MTNEQLNALNKKDLTEKARQLGVLNPSALRKDELVKAIVKAEKKLEKSKERQQARDAAQKDSRKPVSKSAEKSSKPVAKATEKIVEKNTDKAAEPAKTPAVNGKHGKSTTPPTSPAKPVAAPSSGSSTKPTPTATNGKHKPVRAAELDDDDDDDDDFTGEEDAPRSKFDNGTTGNTARGPRDLPSGYQKDRVVVAVIDPYWLHCYWELTSQSVQRAEAAMGPDWHSCKPILRLLDVSAHDTTSTAESIVKDIDLHGGATNWYIQVDQPPKSYRVDIGYLSRRGQFFQICRSDIITTPKAGVSEVVEGSWSMDEKQAERILAMSTGFDPAGNGSSLELKRFFEERFRRPLGTSPVAGTSSMYGSGKDRKFFFEIKAELTIYGRTEAGSRVTLQGEPMVLDNQGRFAMRYSLPDGRQIIPAVATSGDGIEERTIVLAIERNTKQLEPMIHDGMNDDR